MDDFKLCPILLSKKIDAAQFHKKKSFMFLWGKTYTAVSAFSQMR